MKVLNTTLLLVMPLLLTSKLTTAVAAPLPLGAALNIAAKQRFLSQRMAKDFMMIGLGVETTTAANELRASILLFEENLNILEEAAPSNDIKEAILQVRDLWKTYKTLVVTPPTKDRGISVLDGSTQILVACEELVKVFKKYIVDMQEAITKDINVNNETIATVIAISGRQRMLSQRLTLFYAAYIWELPDPSVPIQLRNLHEEFKNAMRMLYSSTANNQEIDDALSVVMVEWQAISDLKAMERKEISLTDCFLSSNKIMVQMDKVTALYVKQTE